MKKTLLFILFPVFLFGQTPIFRSVQPGVTSALSATGGTLTISGSTATFSLAQPDSIGVGDAIQYDSDDNGSIDAICFIHGRTSGTEYTVKNAAGAAPTAVAGDEDWDIFRAYSDLQECDDGTENVGIDAAVRAFDAGNRNIVSANETWHVALYPGTDNGWTHNGWTDSPTNYFEAFTPYLTSHVGSSQRHDGIFSNNKFKISVTSGFGISISTPGGSSYGLKVDGVTVVSSGSSGRAIDINAAETNAKVWISNCLISQTASGSSYGIYMSQDADRTVYIWNNVIVGGVGDTGIFNDDNAGTIYTYNNTIILAGSGAKGIDRQSVTGNTMIAKNNIVQITSGTSTACYEGTFSVASDYNLSSDITAVGDNSVLSTTLTFENSGSQNYHLTSADAVIAIGTDLSADANLPFSTDIDSDTRSAWNMGADEFQGSSQNYYRRRIIDP